MIELLVAATIIAILTAIGLVSFRTANIKARNAKRRADLEQVRAALEIYRSDYPTYPAYNPNPDPTNANFMSMVALQLIANSYLTSNVSDPKDVTPYLYEYANKAAGDASGYDICGYLEPDATQFCLVNP